MELTKDILAFIAKNLYILSNIPFIEVDDSGSLISSLAPADYKLPSFLGEHLKNMLAKLGKQKGLLEDYPGLPLCLCIYRSENKQYFVWGPVLYHSPSSSEQHKLHTLLQKDERDYPLCKTTYDKLISTVSGFAFAADQYLLTPAELHSSATSQPITDNLAKDMVHYLIQQEIDRLNNHTYADEEYTLKLLENGELEKMQEHMKQFHIAYPQIFPSSSRKTDEYMAIASIGIMARTAIRGGVTSAESFRLSDIFLQKIAQCKEQRDILSVRNDAFIEFTRLVHDHSHHSNANNYVDDCKKNIASKIFQKISLDDIAKDLGLEKTYLARLFSASEGMTVGQYIRREKIKLAKNMLTYSDRSILDIANYLGFDSQSYFGKQFLSETGLTPNQYRRKYHSLDF